MRDVYLILGVDAVFIGAERGHPQCPSETARSGLFDQPGLISAVGLRAALSAPCSLLAYLFWAILGSYGLGLAQSEIEYLLWLNNSLHLE